MSMFLLQPAITLSTLQLAPGVSHSPVLHFTSAAPASTDHVLEVYVCVRECSGPSHLPLA